MASTRPRSWEWPLKASAVTFATRFRTSRVDPATGLPYENAPGVLSLEMMRPSSGCQFFAGPLPDVAPGEDTYSSLEKESLYCASCHTAKFWGTQIYDSYGEWLASPYSDPVTGQTCQDCHMPSTGATLFARAEVGGQYARPGHGAQPPHARSRQTWRCYGGR